MVVREGQDSSTFSDLILQDCQSCCMACSDMGIDLVKQITRGILLGAGLRRRVMIGAILIAAAMVFAGSVFLHSFLMARPWVFLFYWLACAWITLLAVLLALFDMLLNRKIAAQKRGALKKEIFGHEEPHDPL